MTSGRSSAEFFDDMYTQAADPWQFSTDPYELHRYEVLLAHVDPDRHPRVFEPGCSVGVFTSMLGARCRTVHATDLSPTAVERTRERCAHLHGVSVRVGGLVPEPDHQYDLVMFSEVGYYLEPAALIDTLDALSTHVAPGGRLIAAHWIGHSADHVQHGSDVHRLLGEVFATWRQVHHATHLDAARDGFVIDVWDRS